MCMYMYVGTIGRFIFKVKIFRFCGWLQNLGNVYPQNDCACNQLILLLTTSSPQKSMCYSVLTIILYPQSVILLMVYVRMYVT